MAGFTNGEIKQMDQGIYNYCIQRINELKMIDLVNLQLSILEAGRLAKASIEGRQGHGHYVRYKKDLISRRERLSEKPQEVQTLWGRYKRGRSVKIH